MFLKLFNRLKEISSFIYMTTLELNEQLKNKLKIMKEKRKPNNKTIIKKQDKINKNSFRKKKS